MSGWRRCHPVDWPALSDSLLPSTWHRLPRELVLLIVESSRWLVPAATLCQWCLVDRTWYRLAVTPLYNCIALSPHDDDRLGAWRIQRFCDTISRNKQLANLVKALDFAVSREETGIANQEDYLAILSHCRNLLYFRNLQRMRDPEETYLLSVPSGALARLRWHDSDLRAFEELVESVFKPLHFRSNPDARGIERSDMIATTAQSAGRMLFDLRLLARLPSVHKLPKGFFRRMVSSQLPRQKILTARCSKNYQNDRVASRIAVGIIQMVSRLFSQLELVEVYIADRDFHTGAPLHFVSKASRTGLPCLYPRAFWDDSIRQLLALGPLPFAVAVYHVCSNEVGDAPGFDIGGEYDWFPTERASGSTSDLDSASEEYPYTLEEDDLSRRTTTGHGWQEPFMLLPNSSRLVPIKLRGGYRSLPFPSYNVGGKAAWEVLVDPPEDIMPDNTQMVDAQEEWDVESMLGASRPKPSTMHPWTPRRGSLDWLRLVARNLEYDQHDLFL